MRRLCVILGILLTFVNTSCTKKTNILKIAATPVPHAQILEVIKEDLAKEGIDLKIIEVTDYATPNRLLAEKEVDANFFQHAPFLEGQIERLGYPLMSLVSVHIEPLGIYSSHLKTIEDIPEKGRVALPNDPTNEARALDLLVKAGLIELKKESGPYRTPFDIERNKKNLKFEEIDAPLLIRTLKDVDLAVIPANFALQGGVNPRKGALLLESIECSPYANLVAIRQSDKDNDKLKVLKRALLSQKVKNFVLDQFEGSISTK